MFPAVLFYTFREMEHTITPEFTSKLTQMTLLSQQYRGIIINEATRVESLIEDIICRYFTNKDNKKHLELMHVLIGTEKISFSVKEVVLRFIIENAFPQFDKENGFLKKGISQVIKFRNIVAHKKFAQTYEDVMRFDGTTIFLKGWQTEENKISLKPFELNRTIVNENYQLMIKIDKSLRELQGLI